MLFFSTEADPVPEMTYDLKCQCDAIRVTKTVRPYSIACSPINENSVALIISDGRVMVWELKSSVPGKKNRNARLVSFDII